MERTFVKDWRGVHKAALALILRHIADRGSPPSPAELQVATAAPSAETVQHMLQEMESRGLIFRDPGSGSILAAYPLSAVPTAHRVRLADGRQVQAMCAVDALGVALVFGQDTHISSRCRHCRADIEVSVVGERIGAYSPASAVVWYTPAAVHCAVAAEGQCPYINFFCSREHVKDWKRDLSAPRGQILPLERALDRARAVFNPMKGLGGGSS